MNSFNYNEAEYNHISLPVSPLKCHYFMDTGLENVRVELDSIDLWRKFHSLKTEMVITKSGRFDQTWTL